MTYCLDQQSSVLESAPKVVQVLDTFFPCIVRPCIIKWATTQVVTDMIIHNFMKYVFSGTQKAGCYHEPQSPFFVSKTMVTEWWSFCLLLCSTEEEMSWQG